MTVTQQNIIRIDIPEDHIHEIVKRAQGATLNGRSDIFKSRAERSERVSQDQFVSQAAQYALSVWLTGEIHPWRLRRIEAEKTPRKGTGGQQLVGSNVQVRSSKLKPGADPLTYRLVLRERERREDAVYVLGVVQYDFDDQNDRQPSNVVVHLVGWASDDMVPAYPESSPPFQGAYLLNSYDLHPLPKFKWGLKGEETPRVDDLARHMELLGAGVPLPPRTPRGGGGGAVGSFILDQTAREITRESDALFKQNERPPVSVANGNEPQEIVIRIKVER